jgi:hypothetical protein
MAEFEATRNGLSRRDLLKRGALAGGLAWTAPLVRSVWTPAYAQSGNFEACCQCSQSPPFPRVEEGLSCESCAQYCLGHGGVKVYTRGVGCLKLGQGCRPTDTCPQIPCAWEQQGPQKLKRAR